MQGFGFLLALIGFWIFYQQHLTALPANKSEYTKGTLLTVSAALTWAVLCSYAEKANTSTSGNHFEFIHFRIANFALFTVCQFRESGSLKYRLLAAFNFSGDEHLNFLCLPDACPEIYGSGKSQRFADYEPDHHICNHGCSNVASDYLDSA